MQPRRRQRTQGRDQKEGKRLMGLVLTKCASAKKCGAKWVGDPKTSHWVHQSERAFEQDSLSGRITVKPPLGPDTTDSLLLSFQTESTQCSPLFPCAKQTAEHITRFAAL